MKRMIVPLLVSFSFILSEASAQSAVPTETASSFAVVDTAAFKGKYKFENLPFEYIEVSVEQGKLFFVGGEYNGFLEPVKDKKDVFDVGGGVATFTFGRNKENKIETLKVDYDGQSFEGKKEEKKAS